jgi:hypothetical protein
MVLMRRLLPILLCALALDGCIKARPPVVAVASEDVAVAPVRVESHSRTVLPAPARLEDGLLATLSERNLRPMTVPDAEIPGLLGRGNGRMRLEQLAARDASAELLVLVEAEPSFYAQVAGRYRWTVAVTLTLADRADLDAAQVLSFDVPVFLQFSHEKEDAALAEATPVIQRKLGEMLDVLLTSRQGGQGG